jgi:hypothetical protein
LDILVPFKRFFSPRLLFLLLPSARSGNQLSW